MPQIGTQIRLLRGQSHAAHFKRGTVIAVASGSVRVISRVRLEHTSLTTQTLVLRGGVFQVRCSDWLEILADSDALVGLPHRRNAWAALQQLRRTTTGSSRHFWPLAPVPPG